LLGRTQENREHPQTPQSVSGAEIRTEHPRIQV
jgi:hypothetical protein